MGPENRNPWVGINSWREFLWDLLHPIHYWSRGWDGIEEAAQFIKRGFKDY